MKNPRFKTDFGRHSEIVSPFFGNQYENINCPAVINVTLSQEFQTSSPCNKPSCSLLVVTSYTFLNRTYYFKHQNLKLSVL